MRGHIRRRGKTWSIVIFHGFDENGKRKYKWYSGFTTKKEAEKALAIRLQEVHSGNYIEPSNETLSSFLQKWIDYKKTQVRQRSIEIYEKSIRLHIIPKLGFYEINKLRSHHLRSFYSQLSEEGLSNRYISQIHSILHNAFKKAVEWEMLPRNIVETVDAPRPVRIKFSVWTLEESQRFLKANENHRFYIAFLLALTTGMRLGEILALRWSDIHFFKSQLTVNRTASQHGGKMRFSEPKSNSGIRTITLPAEVIVALEKHKNEQNKEKELAGLAYENQDLVIARKNGNLITQSFLRKKFMESIARANVPPIRFHDLRHTHASLLLLQGVHPKVVSERLGHSKISTTLDTYSHVLPGMQEQVAKEFGTLLFGSETNLRSHD
ncbi:site-specific integrase [Sulfoacidibacillus thermotolerans]|uniref:Site-specific integrase n=1 Tax=Sulfoacidibacillus thermotolerans TaxID=1765684 RepID=A0A2U3D5X7_SULT2|nr:site-specific integrase [Sulfoacidibacillus thermotolerans]PWI56668.1 site-specific integrase [Sulfoacidibacillus thermotolerans]